MAGCGVRKHLKLDSGAFVTDAISHEQGRRLILDVDANEVDGVAR